MEEGLGVDVCEAVAERDVVCDCDAELVAVRVSACEGDADGDGVDDWLGETLSVTDGVCVCDFDWL